MSDNPLSPLPLSPLLSSLSGILQGNGQAWWLYWAYGYAVFEEYRPRLFRMVTNEDLLVEHIHFIKVGQDHPASRPSSRHTRPAHVISAGSVDKTLVRRRVFRIPFIHACIHAYRLPPYTYVDIHTYMYTRCQSLSLVSVLDFLGD